MPRQNIDYSKTIIYKIVCKDVNITDCYVGSTTDFIRRKNKHKFNSKSYISKSEFYVYEVIRNNGGWENWEMIEIEKYNAVDHNDALRKERFYLEELKATLNKARPIITKEEKEEYKKKWDEINKDKMKEYNREYRKENIVKKLELDKEYYEKNKEHIKSNVSKYRENNKDKIKEYQKEKITCECGCLIYRNNILRHKRSQKHVEIMKTLL
jgi:hypothetical protein